MGPASRAPEARQIHTPRLGVPRSTMTDATEVPAHASVFETCFVPLL